MEYKNPYIKVTGCLSVCLQLRISLTTEPIWLSFTVKLFIVPGKVYNYFRGTPTSQGKWPLEKHYPHKYFLSLSFKTEIQNEVCGLTPPSLSSPQVPLEASIQLQNSLVPKNVKQPCFYIINASMITYSTFMKI